jgi:hypothetical protein
MRFLIALVLSLRLRARPPQRIIPRARRHRNFVRARAWNRVVGVTDFCHFPAEAEEAEDRLSAAQSRAVVAPRPTWLLPALAIEPGRATRRFEDSGCQWMKTLPDILASFRRSPRLRACQSAA